MSQEKLELFLVTALKKLEETTEKIIKTRGYANETKKMRTLQELIKEQLRDENSHHPNRQVR